MRIDTLNRQLMESTPVQYTQKGCPITSEIGKPANVEIGKFKGFLKEVGYKGDVENVTEQDIQKLIKLLGEDSSVLSDVLCKVEGVETANLDELEGYTSQEESEYGITAPCSAKKYKAIKDEKDSMYLANLANDIISVNSLYAGSFSGTTNKDNYNYSKEELEGVLRKNGVGITESSLWGVNKLLEYGVDVSATNISKIQNIKTAVESLEYQEKIQEEFEENTGISEDHTIIKDDKLLYSEKDINDIKESLGELSEEDLQEAIKLKDISINTLKKLMHENTNKVLKKSKLESITNEDISQRPSEEVIATSSKMEDLKAHIETIRLKLTVESAQKLSGKLSLEFTPLEEVSKELLAEEVAHIKKAFEKADISPTTDEVSLVQKIATAAQKVRLNMDIVPVRERELSLEKLENFLEQYAVNETTAKTQFKEGFSKVQEQVPQLLESLGIDVDQITVRAAKALILNNIPVTPETINESTKVLVKVDLFIQELTPYKAVELFKNGINPYTAEVDKILDWSGSKSYPVLKENVAEMLVTIDRKGIATEEQKQALMGLYKVLNSVEQNKEAVAGYIFKKGGLLSIEKFNEALKTLKKHIEIDVDDSLGEKIDVKNLDKQVKQIVETSHKIVLEEKEILQKIELSSFNLNDIDHLKQQEIKSDLYVLLKKHIKNEMSALGLEKTVPTELVEKLEYIKDTNPVLLQKMIDNNIPLSIFNIFWTKKMYDSPDALLNKDKVSINTEFPASVSEFVDNIEKAVQKEESNKRIALKKGDLLQYQTHKESSEELSFQKNILNKQGVYQIPFVVNGEHRTVNLFIEKKEPSQNTNEKSAETVATISYDTKSLGKVKAKITLRGEEISYDVYTDTTGARACLNDEKESLQQMIEGLGKVILGQSYKIVEKNTKPTVRRGGSLFEEVV